MSGADKSLGSSFFIPPEKQKISIQYEQSRPLYDKLITELKYILKNALSERRVENSSYQKRIKTFDSFYKKILRKQINTDYFNAIEDIAGIRIICVYRSELITIEEAIRSTLDVRSANLIRNRSFSSFGYLSDHYIVKLPANCSGARYDSIKDLKCEIQVRTISMHAWATVSHNLDYKQDIDIPSNLKNDFYALSGVFYIADSLFERLKIERGKTLKLLQKTSTQNKFNLSSEFNLDTMIAYVKWKFPDREFFGKADISDLLTSLTNRGINSFQALDLLIEQNFAWMIEEEKVAGNRRHNKEKPLYTGSGAIRSILYHTKKL
jgi:putative GTP pyrophosphokinase